MAEVTQDAASGRLHLSRLCPCTHPDFPAPLPLLQATHSTISPVSDQSVPGVCAGDGDSGVAIGTSLSGFLAAFCNIVTAKERVVLRADSRCIPLLPLPPRRFLSKSGQTEIQLEQQCVFHPIPSIVLQWRR